MHEVTTRIRLKGIQSGGPDKAAIGGVTFCSHERIVNGAIGNLMIAVDLIVRNRLNFTARGYADS
jgi:hypothetical protein